MMNEHWRVCVTRETRTPPPWAVLVRGEGEEEPRREKASPLQGMFQPGCRYRTYLGKELRTRKWNRI